MRKTFIPYILMLSLLFIYPPALYAEEEQNTNSMVQEQVIDVSSGIPLVTNEQVVNKLNRMNQEVYFLAQGSIGWWMVNVLWILVLLGIFFKKAWLALGAAFIGFLFVMFGPQIMGYLNHLTKV
ncbi:hypothetical protein [Desulforamulus ruminis]|uniref:Uncharacterized protein n=1 Tax=Desulforamulus ruminis (strain ATCC 23193 / DSM 2154 / NCIMB 8452 / DL) TaxID=696281 RepID=F6DQ51_DESRL|nr:hypothetical protein [Desulforamulus ruminis]AEG61995.1 hypothetical protein Desru_3795 [Desulforamulus ruminis DSM 2154]